MRIILSFESNVTTPDKEIAYLAGGCLGMEQISENPGVLIQMLDNGGRIDAPTYADVKKGRVVMPNLLK